MTAHADAQPRWGMAFAVALAAHIALLAAGVWWPAIPAPLHEGSMDAVRIELAPEPQAVAAPPRAHAPGPEQPTPAPTPRPEPMSEPPDAATKDNAVAVEPPVPDTPDIVGARVAAETGAQREAVPSATHVTAPPSADTKADTQAAPHDMSGQAQAVAADWHGALLAHLERHRRYPRQAQRRGEQGVSYVRFDVDRAGDVLAPSIARSSGSSVLDGEALSTVRRASPVPVPPDAIAGRAIEVVVPVTFVISR